MGQRGCQGLVDLHRLNAVRICDCPHAAEHHSALLSALQQAEVRLPAETWSRLLHHLMHRGPRAWLHLAARLPVSLLGSEAGREPLGSFHKRVAQMDYPHVRQQGWPSGSGLVESANKLVVDVRLKGAGMPWAPHNVNAMLAFRKRVCHHRWPERWQTGQEDLGEQLHQRRMARALQRKENALTSPPPSPPQPTPSPQAPSIASSPPVSAATLPGSSRPSPSSPWKRGTCLPVFKILCKNLGSTQL